MTQRADRLRDRKWGTFTHYLYHEQNAADRPSNPDGIVTDWNDCVDELDVAKYAEQLSQTGAGHAFITLMQGKRFMCAPNQTFDDISGYAPGEACSRRDLILDLHRELSKYDIDLYLYYTGDGPYQDAQAGERFGFTASRENLSLDFVKKWAKVLREYAVRYGDKVKGWWIDGCYAKKDFSGGDSFGYTDELLLPYKEAVLAGNPNALVAFNNGVGKRVLPYSKWDDFTAGEMNDFFDLPDSRFLEGAQWHTLAPIGKSPTGNEWGGWCAPGIKRDAAYMNDYIDKVNAKEGVVTIDIHLRRNGEFDPQQLDLLRNITTDFKKK